MVKKHEVLGNQKKRPSLSRGRLSVVVVCNDGDVVGLVESVVQG